MRILHLIDNLGIGGAQILLKGFFEQQESSKDIFLFSLRSKSHGVVRIAHSNIINSSSHFIFSFTPYREIISIIKKENIDILHCHLFKSQVFSIIIKILFKRNLKIIFHEHGRIFGSENKIKFDDYFYIRFLKYFKNKVDCFISISQASKNKLISRCNLSPERIIVLYNFISDKFINYSNSETFESNSNVCNSENLFTVGFAGRIVKRKGWKTFLNAARLLKDDNKIKFIIAGDGQDKKELLSIVKEYKLSEQLTYLGFATDIINDFYKKINCLAIPSEWEPMGLVELEAQALGIPVIATNVEALNEIIENNVNGLLFEANNSYELSAKIQQIKNNKELKDNLIYQGHSNSKKYNFTEYAKRLDEIYNNLKDAGSK